MKDFSAWWPFWRPPPGRPCHLGRAVDVFVDCAFKPMPPKLNRHACRPQAPISAPVPVERSYNETVGEESVHAESAPAGGEAVPPQILRPFVPGNSVRGGSAWFHISISIRLGEERVPCQQGVTQTARNRYICRRCLRPVAWRTSWLWSASRPASLVAEKWSDSRARSSQLIRSPSRLNPPHRCLPASMR